LQIEPNNYLAHLHAGNVLLDMGQLPEALSHLEKALALLHEEVSLKNRK
jgi:hypothetical protein